ncbi:MAG TPA: hypothetical protein VK879_13290 [Candidatus Sulfomarinibacteraceae bacterium]|nr:hypothetical protein [Candidatus Sulfomarinibacteraceae bacterium]
MGYLQKWTLLGALGILLGVLLFFGEAAQTATVRQNSALSCEDGYAFWAQTTNSTEDSYTVDWLGSDTEVQGNFRSNGSIHVGGSDNRVTGAVEYGSTFQDGGDDNVFGALIKVSPSPLPVTYQLSDYQPGGTVAQQAQAEGRYHLINGKMEIADQGTRLDGLYYVRGKVEISASDVYGTFTIVAEGKVEISGSNQNFEPYAGGLLFYTPISGTDNFIVSGGNSRMEGIIFAPQVGMTLSGSNNTFEGVIYTGRAKLNGSSLDMRFNGAYCPQGGGAEQTSTPTPTDTPSPTSTSGPTSTPPPTQTQTPTPTPTNTDTPGPSPTPTGTGTPEPPPAGHDFYLPLAMFLEYSGPGEPNNSCSQAHRLVVGREYQFLAEDRDDWYYAEVTSGGQLTVRLTNFVPRQGQVALYYGNSCGALDFLRNNGDTATEKTITMSNRPPGRYYIYVSNDGALNETDPYQLLIRVDAP